MYMYIYIYTYIYIYRERERYVYYDICMYKHIYIYIYTQFGCLTESGVRFQFDLGILVLNPPLSCHPFQTLVIHGLS